MLQRRWTGDYVGISKRVCQKMLDVLASVVVGVCWDAGERYAGSMYGAGRDAAGGARERSTSALVLLARWTAVTIDGWQSARDVRLPEATRNCGNAQLQVQCCCACVKLSSAHDVVCQARDARLLRILTVARPLFTPCKLQERPTAPCIVATRCGDGHDSRWRACSLCNGNNYLNTDKTPR
jgi:hypothetical protein